MAASLCRFARRALLAAPLLLAACTDAESTRTPVEPIFVRTPHGILEVMPEYGADGSIIIQGDIRVSAEELARATIAPEELERAIDELPNQRAAVRSIGGARWEGGEIPFRFHTSMTNAQDAIAQDAIDHWEDVTPFDFVAYDASTHTSWVEFVPGTDPNACSSHVGRQGGRQEIAVGQCDWPRVAHEIGHAVGFYHEQSRVDRDTYVTINWGNIEEGRERNFEKYTARTNYSDGQDLGPYDYGSIMHYAAFDFSDNGQATITPVQAGAVIGQRVALSTWDRYAALSLYSGTRMTGPQGPKVTLYRNASYQGTSQSFLPGHYAAASLNMLDIIGDNQATSIIVPDGLRARLWTGNGEPNFGEVLFVNGNMAQLPASMDNQVSAIRVERAVTAYRDANRTGVKQTFGHGTYRADQGQLNIVGNDQITSLLVPDGLVVELCISETGGTCQTFEGVVNNVGATLDNRASLVRVKSAVTLFQEARLWGNRKSLTLGTYDYTDFAPVANNALSSLVAGEGLAAIVCDSASGTGACQRYRGDVTHVGAAMNDRASYVRVVANSAP